METKKLVMLVLILLLVVMLVGSWTIGSAAKKVLTQQASHMDSDGKSVAWMTFKKPTTSESTASMTFVRSNQGGVE